MRGGSQAQLLADRNGGQWVVKFLISAQHPRTLAGEWIASTLARAIGLTVAGFDIMDVSADMIEGYSATVLRCGSRGEEDRWLDQYSPRLCRPAIQMARLTSACPQRRWNGFTT
ncbi:MAG: HipA family kinase [Terriglobales bacterium]